MAPMTFRINVLDQHAPALRLLTYLTPEFEALLEHGVEALDYYLESKSIVIASPRPSTSAAKKAS